MAPFLKRKLTRLALFLGLVLLFINGIAWFHVHSMTSWRESPSRTEKPEELGSLDKLGVLLRGVAIPRPTNRSTPETIGRSFETLYFASESGAELEAWYVPKEGADVTALLFHGYASSKSSMLSVASGLLELGCSVLLVDFYGSGGSSGTGTTIGIQEAHDVRAAVQLCRRRWPQQRCLLYGQSMGGAAILRAIARLEVSPDAIVVESTFDRLSSTVTSRFQRMNLPATPFSQLLVLWGSVRIGVNAFQHNPVEDAASVSCPSLVLQGSNDPNISIQQARSLATALAGWSRFAPIEKVGHEDIRRSDLKRWQAEVSALLARLRR